MWDCFTQKVKAMARGLWRDVTGDGAGPGRRLCSALKSALRAANNKLLARLVSRWWLSGGAKQTAPAGARRRRRVITANKQSFTSDFTYRHGIICAQDFAR